MLSPTHLHEFKSADKSQAPVMSLYLPEQKLGSHSTEGGSSNKFVLKGRQTGSMHRGHTWVFRAESHDTMMAWYDDIRMLTERTPEERSNLVRGHVRSFSRASQRSSLSSDGMGDDDEEPPFSTAVGAVSQQQPRQDTLSRRPSGGRFPSDLQVNAQRGLQVPSPLSVSSGHDDHTSHDFAVSGSSPLGNPSEKQHHDLLREHGGGYEGSQSQTHHEIGSTFLPGSPGRRDTYDVGAAQRVAPTAYGKFPTAEPTNSGPPEDLYRGPLNRPMGYDAAVGLPVDARGFVDSGQIPRSQSQSSPTNGADRGTDPAQQDGTTISNWDQKGTRARGVPDGTVGAREDVDGGYLDEQRPRGAVRNDSGAPTISHLHIPGEYPKGTSGY